jgi:hypothetical protein
LAGRGEAPFRICHSIPFIIRRDANNGKKFFNNFFRLNQLFMKRIFLPFALLFFLNHLANAQALVQLGEPLVNDLGYDLLFTQGGGFVTSGTTDVAAVLYKVDCAGNLIAQIEKTYSPGPGRFFDAVELPDGSIVAAGSATIATPTDTLERVLLLKTTANLAEIATSNFLVLNKYARAKSLTLASNGDLFVLGEVNGISFDFTDMFLLRVNPNTLQPIGDPVIFNNGVDVAEEIIRSTDGNYLLAGNSFYGNIFNPNAMIDNRLQAIKVNESGGILWQYTYQDTFLAQYGLAHLGGVEQNEATSNFMLAGTAFGDSPEMHQDVIFILLDNNGNFLDSALLQSPMRQGIYGMAKYSDFPGLFVAVGDSENPVFGTPNLLAAQAYELNGQIFQTNLINDVATPLSITDVVGISPNRLALIGTLPDNPVSLASKDILVATPGIEDIEIVYQNCALTASLGAPNPSYQWYLNNTPIPGATSGFYFPTESGVYQVQITDDIGCFGFSDTLTVMLASAGFEVTTDNLTATFTNTSAGATFYSWNFGDSQTSSETNPTHTYAAGGTYTVTLIASSQCSADTISQTIGLVSAGEPAWLNHFRLFPNPNEGVFILEINGEPQSELTFSMFNQIGQAVDRQVFDFKNGNLQHTFDFGHLPPGIYTLQMQAQGEAKHVKVAVK